VGLPPPDDATPGRSMVPGDRIRPVAVGGSGGPDRRSVAVALSIVAILVVAIVKPWPWLDAPLPPPTPPPRPAVAAVTPSEPPASRPSRSPSPSAPAAGPGDRDPGGQCELADAFRVFTVEVDAGRPVISWLPVEPVAATGPDAADFPTVRIIADRVAALGFCARVVAGSRRPITRVDAWAVPASGAPVAVRLAPLAAWTPRDPDAGRAWRPPAESTSLVGGWAPGDWVFAVRHGPDVTDSDWYRVRIVISPGAGAVSAPPPASPAAPTPRPTAP
jgi:hypothetical protein